MTDRETKMNRDLLPDDHLDKESTKPLPVLNSKRNFNRPLDELEKLFENLEEEAVDKHKEKVEEKKEADITKAPTDPLQKANEIFEDREAFVDEKKEVDLNDTQKGAIVDSSKKPEDSVQKERNFAPIDEEVFSKWEVPNKEEKQVGYDVEKKEEKGFLKNLLSWLTPLASAIFLAVFIRLFIGGATTVQGQSMEPTLQNGDILLVSKVHAYMDKFSRADVVIMIPPGKTREDKVFYVKRIIGLPGEKVEIKEGKVFIDGQWMKEFYTGEVGTDIQAQSEWVLGADEYFVLGDNRLPGASNDSRFFGPVHKSNLTALAFFRVWPLKHLGGI